MPEGALEGDRAESWPVLGSEDLHRDTWVMALRRDTVKRPTPSAAEERPFPRLVLEHPGAALILAVDDAMRVLVVRQYRHAAGRRFLELPAGLCDVDGEDRLEVARRELLEETGFVADRWAHLLTSYPSPGISAERMDFFVATGLSQSHRGDFELAHEEADMSVEWVALDELVQGVLDGRIANGPLGLAVLAYTTHLARGTSPFASR